MLGTRRTTTPPKPPTQAERQAANRLKALQDRLTNVKPVLTRFNLARGGLLSAADAVPLDRAEEAALIVEACTQSVVQAVAQLCDLTAQGGRPRKAPR